VRGAAAGAPPSATDLTPPDPVSNPSAMPARFCAQCGTAAVPGGKFCAECGTPLGGAARPRTSASGRWQLTAVGSGVLGFFLCAGLAMWTVILSPATPRPGPGGQRPAAGPPAVADGGQAPARKLELPDQVKTFIADLATKAKERPKDAEAWLRLAQVNARAAQLDPAYHTQALEAFEHVLGLEANNPDALRGAANVHYDRNDHAKAIPLYERYLKLRADDASARTDLGTMYLYAGDAPRAIATYQEVIRQNPSFVQAHYNLAVTYHQQGKNDEALAELEVARGVATDDGFKRQIDDMIATLRGTPPPAAAAAPVAGAPPAADASRTPFQRAVEDALRAHPIMGPRIARFEWPAAGTGRVLVNNFPMAAMPDGVREKFLGRLGQELRTASGAHPVQGPVSLEIADASSGDVMATAKP
jgi:cytochrome c-type biogenesis protein CcmH/NrfG